MLDSLKANDNHVTALGPNGKKIHEKVPLGPKKISTHLSRERCNLDGKMGEAGLARESDNADLTPLSV